MPAKIVKERVGRRGAFLAAHGLLAILLGYAYTAAQATPAVKHMLRYALEVMPLWMYGVLWLISGVVAITTGLWLRRFEVAGFMAAITVPTIWAMVWITADAPWRVSILSGVIFLAYALPVGIVAGMPDVSRHAPRE